MLSTALEIFHVIFEIFGILRSSDITPQTVGRDSGVPFSLGNFQEDILLPTKSKMSPTSNLGP